MNTHRPPVGFKALVVLFVCVFGILPGCAALNDPTSSPMPTFGKPELLFLKSYPYRRLVVEIEAVEGWQPSPVAVQTLRNFLAKYCDKPEGIQIMRDKSIPRREARGVSPWILALAHMKGPEETKSKSKPAYLYVFCYDSSIADAKSRDMDLPSYVSSNYPCGIFVDISYWGPSYQTFMPRVLCHEASHVLGADQEHRPWGRRLTVRTGGARFIPGTPWKWRSSPARLRLPLRYLRRLQGGPAGGQGGPA